MQLNAAPPRDAPTNRVVPVVYFAAGHLALLSALATIALRPEAFAGFFLGPRPAGAVHAITLGWLTTSILGALYLVWPMALGRPLPTGRADLVAALLVLLGISGVVAHLWLDSYDGAGWSGLVALVGAAYPVGRFLRRLPAARGPAPVRLHVGLALVNFLLTIALGVLLAFDKQAPFLPCNRLDGVFGHLHLGLVGWVALMVVGIGYRLIPMYLPALPPKGAAVWGTAILLETGALGLAGAFFLHKPLAPWFAGVTVAGLLLFLVNLGRLLRSRVPSPPKLRRPDIGMLHTAQALVYLALSLPLGLWLLLSPIWHLEWIKVYGVFVLIGFPAQMVLGIAMRLFPMFAWKEAWLASGYKKLPANPHEMPARPLQWSVLVLWTAGVPLLCVGLAREGRHDLIRVGAATLTLGLLCAAANTALVLRHLFGRAESRKKRHEKTRP